jgi:hypothetical protein
MGASRWRLPSMGGKNMKKVGRPKADDGSTTQIRIMLDNKILEHFERQAAALGIKVSAVIQIVIGERYQNDLARSQNKNREEK